MANNWRVASVFLISLVCLMQASDEVLCSYRTIPKDMLITIYKRGDDNVPIGMFSDDEKVLTAIIKLQCNEGFTLIGASHLTCKGSAWSGDMPKCLKSTCWWLDSENAVEFYLNGTKILDRLSAWFPNGTMLKYVDNKAQCLVERLCLENGTWSVSQPHCNIIDELIRIERQPATRRVTDLAHEYYNPYMTWGFAMDAISAVSTCSLLIVVLVLAILMQRRKLNCFEKFTTSSVKLYADNNASGQRLLDSRIPRTDDGQNEDIAEAGYEIPRTLNRAVPVEYIDLSPVYDEIVSKPLAAKCETKLSCI